MPGMEQQSRDSRKKTTNMVNFEQHKHSSNQEIVESNPTPILHISWINQVSSNQEIVESCGLSIPTLRR